LIVRVGNSCAKDNKGENANKKRSRFIQLWIQRSVFGKDDVIQFGQLWEKAIEAQLKIVRESSEGKDFKNGDDAKLVSVRTHARGKSYGANIPGVHNKIGKLLVAVYEKKQRQWFFFKIPNTAFAYIASSSNIEIPFELDGTPRRIPKRRDATNWWKYEVASFQKLK
jgi:hypothetical protein